MSLYLNKPEMDYPVFVGSKYQRGYGFGNIFKKLYKWIKPLIKEKVVPILKTVGKSILKGSTSFGEDVIDGINPKTSAKRRFEETLNELSDKAGVQRDEGLTSTSNTPINKRKSKLKKLIKIRSSKKRKRIFTDIFNKSTKKTKRDIFDQNESNNRLYHF